LKDLSPCHNSVTMSRTV